MTATILDTPNPQRYSGILFTQGEGGLAAGSERRSRCSHPSCSDSFAFSASGGVLERSDYFDEDGGVSVWLGRTKPERDDGVDILRDLCGVESYDLDFQDIVAVGEFEEALVADILRQLSYSSSFLAGAVQAAETRGIRRAFWAIGQYNYAYDPARVYVPIATDPVFIGNFPWSDAEDAQPFPASPNLNQNEPTVAG
jgi:hypothetical protein